MSMNLYIYAEREVRVVKTGRVSTQRIEFDTWQTPTVVTYKILNASDRAVAYMDWVKSESYDEQIPVYAADDLYEEREPVRYSVYNVGLDHLEGFKEWLTMVEEEGYNVIYSAG